MWRCCTGAPTEIITTISMVDDGLVVFRNKLFNGALPKDVNHFGGSACDGQAKSATP
jgi:hypothetical protein